MKKLKKTIILFLLSILVSSCWFKEEVYYYELTKAENQLIPYKLGEVISFINSEGKIFEATVVKDHSYWKEEQYDTGSMIDDYVHYNNRNVTLQSETENISINLGIYAMDRYLAIWTNYHHNIGFNFSYDKNMNLCNCYYYYYCSCKFYNELEINNKIYYNVAEKNNNYTVHTEDGSEKKLNQFLFYNKSHGILQILENDTVIITIDKYSNSK